MTDSAVYLQPAYILQQRQFQETSLIIDVLTRDFGRVPLIAKGVRKAKSKTVGHLQPFTPLSLSYIGKSGLKTLTDVDNSQHSSLPLQGLALYCGFYANELVANFLHPHDPHPEVFCCYGECISKLGGGLNIEVPLRIFELDLLDAIGYGLQLDVDTHHKAIQPLARYHFDAAQGPIEALDGHYSGAILQALKTRNFTDPQVPSAAKKLLRAVITRYLQGKPLKSRKVINDIIRHTKND